MSAPNSDIVIRLLDEGDEMQLVALRSEALADAPLAFASALGDDRALEPGFVASAIADDDSALFGAFDGALLVGMVGLHIPAKAKLRHKVDLWGMYVKPRARGRGAGESLMRAAIAHCRSWPHARQIVLGVTAGAPAARRLYERIGFREWGCEPRALCVDGEFVDEWFYVLDLVAPQRDPATNED